jgi:hypothetical protein
MALVNCWKCKKDFDPAEVDLEETAGSCSKCFETPKEVTEAVGPTVAMDPAAPGGDVTGLWLIPTAPSASNTTVAADFGQMEREMNITLGVGDLTNKIVSVIQDTFVRYEAREITNDQAVEEIREKSVDVLLQNVPVSVKKPSRDVVRALVDACLKTGLTNQVAP